MLSFKGTVSRDFLLQVFSWITFPKPLKITLWSFQIFSKIRGDIRKSRCTTSVNDTGGKFATSLNDTGGKIAAGINGTGGKFATGINDTGGKFCHQFCLCCWHRWQICHRCQRYRRQIIRTISGCIHLKVNLKAKIYIYVNSTTQRCPNKIIKIFRMKMFPIWHRCQQHRWCTLSREYLRECSKKFEMAVMVYSGAWEKLFHEKNQKSKISWHCPFNKVENVLMKVNSVILCW
jgi:hypothetical protein